MNAKTSKAVVLSDRGIIIKILYYEDVYKIRQNVTKFLSQYVRELHQCIGLRMEHNVYIPSIILSLQELQHAFIFLNDDIEPKLINDLGIVWILSFNSTEKCVAKINLCETTLSLERHCCRDVKLYKNVYYVICTSGTTGDRKFVKVGKFSIESNIKCLSRIYNVQTNDVIYFGTPLTFDPSMVELLLALHNNACLLITPSAHQINPTYLYQSLFHSESGIHILQIVPSLFLRWSQDQIGNILLNSKLKILTFGGECFPQSILQYKCSETLRIFNIYGTTEVSCWATIYEVPKEQIDDVPLGNALDDTIIELRDELGHKITEGEGEIFIGSINRICSVINETEIDEKIMFHMTGDIGVISGTRIFCKGRKHDVFKRYGHKIHLSKIEELVQKESGLSNKCIWSKSESKLLLFLMIEDLDVNMKNKILDKVRIKLLHSLPRQYFPDYIHIIRKCPVTSHGKTNKSALETIYLNRNKINTRGPVDTFKSLICTFFGLNEKMLMELQESTFFELGGNSILAVQFLNEFKDEVKSESPDLVASLFEKSIAACLKCVASNKTDDRKTKFPETDLHVINAKRIKNNIELRIAWSYDLQACVDSTPVVFDYRGRILVAVGSFSHIFAVLDANNGAEIAKFVLPNVIEASPCLSPCHNFLYVGCFDGCLYGLDFVNNSINWVYSTSDRIKCKAALCQDFKAVVFGSYDKHVHCIETADGSLIWKRCVEESITSTPLVNQEKIYIATICGTCLCLSEDKGDILWTYKTGSPIFGGPCIVDSSIVFPNVEGRVLFLSLDGKKIQHLECGGHLYSSLINYKNLLIFGCHDRILYIVQIEDGAPSVRKAVNLNEVLTTPCIWKDRIVVAGTSGQLFLVDCDGGLLAQFRLPGDIFSSVVAYDRKLFVGCRDNNLYCVEIKQ